MLVFLICFQAEVKKSLSEFGRVPLFRTFFKQKPGVIEDIISAAIRLSEKKIGALIAIQRSDPLRTIADTGTEVDSLVTADLLRTVFAPYTPLHDGAVVIRNDRLVAAGCLLPLSENPALPREFGTRHRAAIGLTENTDAIVIVCSEETGIVSLATEGRLERPETAESLRQKLHMLFEIHDEAAGDEVER